MFWRSVVKFFFLATLECKEWIVAIVGREVEVRSLRKILCDFHDSAIRSEHERRRMVARLLELGVDWEAENDDEYCPEKVKEEDE